MPETIEDPDLFFVPRPAVARYREFVRVHRIAHAAQSFQADVSVVAGQETSLSLFRDRSLAQATVQFQTPPGWSARVISGGRVGVVAPATAREDVTLLARVGNHRTLVRLHPVPSLKVPRIAPLPWNRHSEDPAWMACGTSKG